MQQQQRGGTGARSRATPARAKHAPMLKDLSPVEEVVGYCKPLT